MNETKPSETKPAEPTASREAAPSPEAMLPPTMETMTSRIDDAWAKRADSGRFDTGGKTAVLYSAEATVSKHRSETLGKAPDEAIHSGELAKQHTKDHPNSITLEQTPGGRELQAMSTWINKSDCFCKDERDVLNTRMDVLWEDASARFADSALEHGKKYGSLAYVENAKADKVFLTTERPMLATDPNHPLLTDAPLNSDGTPADHDQIPDHMLDKDGRFHRA